jgi:hypothetical protein
VAGTTLIAAREPSAPSRPVGRGPVYRCACAHGLQVFGGGRHRVYFELGDERLCDPVMNRACPQCGDRLPGKNRP